MQTEHRRGGLPLLGAKGLEAQPWQQWIFGGAHWGTPAWNAAASVRKRRQASPLFRRLFERSSLVRERHELGPAYRPPGLPREWSNHSSKTPGVRLIEHLLEFNVRDRATMSNSGGTGFATVSNLSLLRPFCGDASLSIDQVSPQPQLSHKLDLIEVEVKTSELSASYLHGYNEGNLNGLAGGRDSAGWRI